MHREGTHGHGVDEMGKGSGWERESSVLAQQICRKADDGREKANEAGQRFDTNPKFSTNVTKSGIASWGDSSSNLPDEKS